MDIELYESSGGDAVVLAPSGRLDLVSAPQLKKLADEVLTNRRTRIVVDLSDVAFMDSSGLGALIGGLKSARQAVGDLRIAGPTEQVLEVLQLTGLDQILRPYPTVQDALVSW